MSVHGDIWDAAEWPSGWQVRHLDETGSTNADLLADLDAGLVGDRSVLVTDHQTAGRGRLDRRWDAPAGTNLLVSIAVSPVPAVPSEATHRIGLAALFAARDVRPDVALTLKWPNDLLLDGAKVAGILAQRSASTDSLVVGLGLNVGWAPDDAARLGPIVAPAELLASILATLDTLPSDIGPTYRSELSTIGCRVRLEVPGDNRFVEGRAVDVDDRGRLLVEADSGEVVAYDAGDVVHVRPLG
ncbi:MAG TPA: biotin--[acetyl-CoA-carboxylase] ligase [Ilumatobacteraceae bacterium]|nr:biotin--[acetyl-CoA-carboxylase] ligase [Ilumatobacteraceae bacterium]